MLKITNGCGCASAGQISTTCSRHTAEAIEEKRRSDLTAKLDILIEKNRKTAISKKEGSMTKEEYFAFHKECTDKMTKITAAKNADYTGKGDDPFANFTRVESVGICSTEQGFLTRMMDKVCRINSFVQNGQLQVKDESVEDTLLDLANYSILFAGYIRSRKGK